MWCHALCRFERQEKCADIAVQFNVWSNGVNGWLQFSIVYSLYQQFTHKH